MPVNTLTEQYNSSDTQNNRLRPERDTREEETNKLFSANEAELATLAFGYLDTFETSGNTSPEDREIRRNNSGIALIGNVQALITAAQRNKIHNTPAFKNRLHELLCNLEKELGFRSLLTAGKKSYSLYSKKLQINALQTLLQKSKKKIVRETRRLEESRTTMGKVKKWARVALYGAVIVGTAAAVFSGGGAQQEEDEGDLPEGGIGFGVNPDALDEFEGEIYPANTSDVPFGIGAGIGFGVKIDHNDSATPFETDDDGLSKDIERGGDQVSNISENPFAIKVDVEVAAQQKTVSIDEDQGLSRMVENQDIKTVESQIDEQAPAVSISAQPAEKVSAIDEALETLSQTAEKVNPTTKHAAVGDEPNVQHTGIQTVFHFDVIEPKFKSNVEEAPTTISEMVEDEDIRVLLEEGGWGDEPDHKTRVNDQEKAQKSNIDEQPDDIVKNESSTSTDIYMQKLFGLEPDAKHEELAGVTSDIKNGKFDAASGAGSEDPVVPATPGASTVSKNISKLLEDSGKSSETENLSRLLKKPASSALNIEEESKIRNIAPEAISLTLSLDEAADETAAPPKTRSEPGNLNVDNLTKLMESGKTKTMPIGEQPQKEISAVRLKALNPTVGVEDDEIQKNLKIAENGEKSVRISSIEDAPRVAHTEVEEGKKGLSELFGIAKMKPKDEGPDPLDDFIAMFKNEVKGLYSKFDNLEIDEESDYNIDGFSRFLEKGKRTNMEIPGDDENVQKLKITEEPIRSEGHLSRKLENNLRTKGHFVESYSQLFGLSSIEENPVRQQSAVGDIPLKQQSRVEEDPLRQQSGVDEEEEKVVARQRYAPDNPSEVLTKEMETPFKQSYETGGKVLSGGYRLDVLGGQIGGTWFVIGGPGMNIYTQRWIDAVPEEGSLELRRGIAYQNAALHIRSDEFEMSESQMQNLGQEGLVNYMLGNSYEAIEKNDVFVGVKDKGNGEFEFQCTGDALKIIKSGGNIDVEIRTPDPDRIKIIRHEDGRVSFGIVGNEGENVQLEAISLFKPYDNGTKGTVEVFINVKENGKSKLPTMADEFDENCKVAKWSYGEDGKVDDWNISDSELVVDGQTASNLQLLKMPFDTSDAGKPPVVVPVLGQELVRAEYNKQYQQQSTGFSLGAGVYLDRAKTVQVTDNMPKSPAGPANPNQPNTPAPAQPNQPQP